MKSPGRANGIVGAMRVPLRGAVEFAIWLMVGLIASRTWCLDGVVIPIAVDSGSMAPTLVGPHRKIVCGDCGFAFVCAWDRHAQGRRAVCPNCGYPGNDPSQGPVLPGDRVLIDRATFQFRPPRRWEVVAFRTPGREKQWSVKRVVGLPGESVALRDGDVYINGEILRKTLDQQEAVSVLVHDADHVPGHCTHAPPRWRPDAETTRWRRDGGRFIFSAGPNSHPTNPIDWLSYRHWRRVPGQPDAVLEGPVLTDPAFEFGRRVPCETIRPTHDLRLSFRWVKASGRGWLYVRAVDGELEFVLKIQAATGRVELLCNGSPLPISAPTGSVLDNLPARVDVSLFDRQFLAAIAGRTIAVYPYERRGDKGPTSHHPFSLGAADASIEVDEVRVFRDAYYEYPLGCNKEWQLEGIASKRVGELFVLGDNAMFSSDSRTWPAGPGVALTAVVGKPLVAVGATEGIDWKGWRFRIPNLTGFRYIR